MPAFSSADFPLPASWDALKLLAFSRQGRNPVFSPQNPASPFVFGRPAAGASFQPTASNDGADVKGFLLAFVGVRLRQTTTQKTFYLKVTDNGSPNQYGAITGRLGSFGGFNVPANPSGAADTVIDLVAAYEGDVFFKAGGGDAVVHPNDDTVARVSSGEYLGLSIPAHQNTGAYTGPGWTPAGTAFQSIVSESDSVLWRVWGMPAGQSFWTPVPGAVFWTNNKDQIVPFQCAGYDRLYVEVLWQDGYCVPYCGPCVADTNADLFLQDAAEINTALYDSLLLSQFPSDSSGSYLDILEAPDFSPPPVVGGAFPCQSVKELMAGFANGEAVTAWTATALGRVDGTWLVIDDSFNGVDGVGFTRVFDVEPFEYFILALTSFTGTAFQRHYRPMSRPDILPAGRL